jgi:hypothetical protein
VQPEPESAVFTTTGPAGNVLPGGLPAVTIIVLSSMTVGLTAITPASETEVMVTLQTGPKTPHVNCLNCDPMILIVAFAGATVGVIEFTHDSADASV